MFYIRRFQWTFLLIFSFSSQFLRTTALQCYSCENCNIYEDLQELHICGELPSDLETMESSSRPTTYTVTNEAESITRTTTITNTPLSTDDATEMTTTISILITTIKPEMKTTTEMAATTTMMTDRPTVDDTTKVEITTTTINEEYTTFYENSEETTLVNVNEDNVETTSTTTQTIPSTTTESTMTTTAVPAAAVTTTTTNQNTEENDYDFGEENNVDYYDDYYLRRKKMHTIQRKQFLEQPICYVTTSFVNGTVKINRGCTNMINNNEHDTCDSILKGSKRSVGDCQICNTNGCNKFFYDFSPQPPTTANNACKINNALFIHIIFISSIVFINLRF